jgi:hypothetical protein
MRRRDLRPEFFTDEQLLQLPVEGRLLYLGLLCFADDEGRGPWSPRELKAFVFPCDRWITGQYIDQLLARMENLGLVRRYFARNRERPNRPYDVYFVITGFKRTQKINRPTPSVCPAPPRRSHFEPLETVHEESMSFRREREAISHPIRILLAETIDSQPDENRQETASNKISGLESAEMGRGTAALSAEYDALTRELTDHILTLLQVPKDSATCIIVARALEDAHAMGLSFPESHNLLITKALVAKRENPPESWFRWFADKCWQDKGLDTDRAGQE